MCLYIDLTEHKNHTPNITKKDILVYKVLYKYIQGGYETPYQNYFIKFENEKFVYPKTDMEGTFCTIEKGIHTHRYREYGEFHVYGYYKLFKAIIPKGSEYYIGTCGDVVSNNLIIFETNKAYNEYAKTHEITKFGIDIALDYSE